ncbi:MAG: STAS domain-containing protein [Candidatus Accumulibacter sp.]|jgi:phospholipid transport system transporter-binding protein|nr:STAS domain-containing protein [Accumulibacter sp.]
MIKARADGRLCLSGPFLIADAPDVYQAGLEFLRPGAGTLTCDFSGVEEADSSALAVLFCWLRVAKERGVTLRVAALPEGLRSLAAVYGVSELLPADQAD